MYIVYKRPNIHPMLTKKLNRMDSEGSSSISSSIVEKFMDTHKWLKRNLL